MLTAKECSDRAATCERLAEQAKDPVIERSYRVLVKTWHAYAERLEVLDLSRTETVVRSVASVAAKMKEDVN